MLIELLHTFLMGEDESAREALEDRVAERCDSLLCRIVIIQSDLPESKLTSLTDTFVKPLHVRDSATMEKRKGV